MFRNSMKQKRDKNEAVIFMLVPLPFHVTISNYIPTSTRLPFSQVESLTVKMDSIFISEEEKKRESSIREREGTDVYLKVRAPIPSMRKCAQLSYQWMPERGCLGCRS